MSAAPTPTPVVPPGSICPTSSALVREFARRTAYGAGAHPLGPARCSGGFAVVRIKADSTPDGVSTIYRIGPPLTYLAMGTGPICSDDPADGEVVVPRRAAAALNCITSSGHAPPTAAPAAAPTLGAVWASNQKGFGQVRPSEVYAGGDPTGMVTGVRWTSWGGPTATGTGTGYWTPPSGFVSDSVDAPARVVASNLGTCHGRPAYLSVTWYFPTKGETGPAPGDGFSSICDG